VVKVTSRLDELFDLKNGLASSNVFLLSKRTTTSIPYIRPAKTQQRTVAGWVEKSSVAAVHRHPKHTIFVSTDGEGSHTYAYVSNFEFVANSNVSILIPKRPMSLAEKIFYAKAIAANRQKFSYGRKPKGERLKAIELPEKPPEWVNSTNLSGFSFDLDLVEHNVLTPIRKQSVETYNVRLMDLFDVYYGVNLELNRLTQNENGVNFVARTSKNNGVSAKVQRLYDLEPTKGMVLSVAGGGSVLEAFLQVEPFYSGRDLYYLKPKVEMTADEMLYYATCIRANQYKYSYGRQANRTLKDLPIPAFECLPSWVNGSIMRVSKQIQESIVKAS